MQELSFAEIDAVNGAGYTFGWNWDTMATGAIGGAIGGAMAGAPFGGVGAGAGFLGGLVGGAIAGGLQMHYDAS